MTLEVQNVDNTSDTVTLEVRNLLGRPENSIHFCDEIAKNENPKLQIGTNVDNSSGTVTLEVQNRDTWGFCILFFDQ